MHGLNKWLALPPAWGLPLVAVVSGCVTPPSPCFVGREAMIPAGDTTAPTVVIDIHMPDGTMVSRSSVGSGPSRITVPSSGTVTLIAGTRDDLGVRDSQLFASERRCSGNPAAGTETYSAPGLLSGPTASNPDT